MNFVYKKQLLAPANNCHTCNANNCILDANNM